jgi:hypothetical protein
LALWRPDATTLDYNSPGRDRSRPTKALTGQRTPKIEARR